MHVVFVPQRWWQCVNQTLLFCARKYASGKLHVAKVPTWQLRVDETAVTRGSRRVCRHSK
jgi:hypothetical protein